MCVHQSLGPALTITGIRLKVAAYGRRAGVRLSCHQLRHTFTRQLIGVRAPVTTVQRLLGHRSLRNTQRLAPGCPAGGGQD